MHSGQILESIGALLEAELKEPGKIMHFARFLRSRSVAGGANFSQGHGHPENA